MANCFMSLHTVGLLIHFVILALINDSQQENLMSIGSTAAAPYLLWNISYDDEYQLILNPVFSEDSELNRTEGLSRSARSLNANDFTHKIDLFFYDERHDNVSETYLTALDPHKFSVADFMIRLQEKYAGACNSFLDSVPEGQNNYFISDDDIVNIVSPEEEGIHFKGTNASNKERKERAEETFDRRYRIFGEDCNPKNEWEFWRDMFLAAENDTVAIPKKTMLTEVPKCGGKPCSLVCYDNEDWFCFWQECDTSTPPKCSGDIQVQPNINNDKQDKQEAFTYVPIPAKVMMNRWNKIWRKYERKGICNQKLLLECDGAHRAGTTANARGEPPKCVCRAEGIGLTSVIKLHPPGVHHDDNTFVTRYYADVEKLVLGKPSRNGFYGQYVHKQMCVFTASVSFVPIANPCDLSLPMIGMCLGNCVVNATCKSVKAEEKEAFSGKYGDEFRPQDLRQRIQVATLRSSFGNKCECNEGKICEKLPKNIRSGTNIVKQPGRVAVTLIQIVLLLYRY